MVPQRSLKPQPLPQGAEDTALSEVPEPQQARRGGREAGRWDLATAVTSHRWKEAEPSYISTNIT